jgi:hypothetical protein
MMFPMSRKRRKTANPYQNGRDLTGGKPPCFGLAGTPRPSNASETVKKLNLGKKAKK